MNKDAVHVLERTRDGGVGVAKTIRVVGEGQRPKMGDRLRVKFMAMVVAPAASACLRSHPAATGHSTPMPSRAAPPMPCRPDHPSLTCPLPPIRFAQLDDGKVVASSPGDSTEVTLGMRELYGTGGDLGLVSMRVGERALISCHSDFAAGHEGAAGVPPDARLTLEVSLLGIVSEERLLGREVCRTLFGVVALATFALGAFWLEGHFHLERYAR